MATDLQALSELLQASLDPRQNKQAEGALRAEEQKPGYSLALLQITATDSFALTTRLASALCFKNFVKWNWRDEDGNYKLPQDETAAIKRELIGLMMTVPQSVQTQLGEAISTIAESDFWENWDTLMDDLVSRLTPDTATVNNGVLQVAHSIFGRWRSLFSSDGLYTEINYVLGKFGEPFLRLLENTDNAIIRNHDNPTALKQYLITLNLLIKIFYDLSCHDLPPIFEENLPAITTVLHKYLVYDNPSLQNENVDDSGVLEEVKVGLFEALILYIQKFEDAFGPLLAPFVSSSWNLLTTVGDGTQHDILVSKALQFLTAIAKIRTHAESFNSEEVIGQVVENVILPNMTLRDSDMELFEDEPIEFIRRDLEGSDSDTRRRAATDFLRQLLAQFEELLTGVVWKYINHYISDYNRDPKANWKSKDTGVYLFSSIAAKGTTTAGQGVKTTNSFTNVTDFFQQHIAGDLVADDTLPILKVDAIKYLYTFRTQIPQSYWQPAFPLIIKHLGSSSYVVYTYAAIALERILTLTDERGKPIIPKADVEGSAENMLLHLFTLMQKENAPEKIQENEFLMRCVMRILITLKEGIEPITDTVLANLINITTEIQKNPSNPHFNYYHFEAFGAVVRFATPRQPEKLEQALFGPFSDILRNDVVEFAPYVFQLFAAVLEASPSRELPELYKSLIPPILMPTLWESKGNVPALVRLLASMIVREADGIARNGQIEPILGVFQKLVSTKTNETYGFELLEAVLSGFPRAALESYFVPMLQIILARLSGSRTENFVLQFVRFYHFIAARDDKQFGADFFINVCDQVQNDVFRALYPSIILPHTQRIAKPFDRKTAVVAFTKTLADSIAFTERYQKGWTLTCEALLKLLILPPLPQTNTDIGPEQDVDDLSFGVGFTPLTTCRKIPQDPFPEVTSMKAWVGQYLKEADTRHNGRIMKYIQERLSEQTREALASYMMS